MSETTTVQVSKHIWNQLDEIKNRNGHTSYDSVIRHLITIEKETPCKGETCIWFWNCMEYGCPKFKEREKEG